MFENKHMLKIVELYRLLTDSIQQWVLGLEFHENQNWNSALAAFDQARELFQRSAGQALVVAIPNALSIHETLQNTANVGIPLSIQACERERALWNQIEDLRREETERKALIERLSEKSHTRIQNIAQLQSVVDVSVEANVTVFAQTLDEISKLVEENSNSIDAKRRETLGGKIAEARETR